MKNFLYQPGTLKQKTKYAFEPDPTEEIDIEIITLHQYLLDQAIDYAWEITDNLAEIDENIQKLLDVKYNKSRQFIKITPQKITVALNANVIQKEQISDALSIIAIIDDLTTPKIIKFGPLYHFQLSYSNK